MTHLLTMVVNGEELPAREGATLRDVIQYALEDSRNTGRPLEDWELRHDSGVRIEDHSKPIEEYGFAPNTHLYVTLKVGALG